MKKWQTIGVTALSTLALSIGGFTTYQYLQPTHYQGDIFNNEKTTQSTTNTIQESSTTTTTSPSSNVEQQPQQSIGTTPALQPTFGIKPIGMCNNVYGTLIETFTVIHHPSGDRVYKAMSEEQANAFCSYMEHIAHGKEKLDYTMEQNFEEWLTNNVK